MSAILFLMLGQATPRAPNAFAKATTDTPNKLTSFLNSEYDNNNSLASARASTPVKPGQSNHAKGQAADQVDSSRATDVSVATRMPPATAPAGFILYFMHLFSIFLHALFFELTFSLLFVESLLM